MDFIIMIMLIYVQKSKSLFWVGFFRPFSFF